jgi:glycosyltransferase involved in cell wall biosynthesis
VSQSADGLSLVLPVHNVADRIGNLMGDWSAALKQSNRETELIVVDDGSTDGTAERVEKAGGARLLRHESPRGFGACIRSALAEARYPIFGYVGSDYPYSPADLKKLLAAYGQHNNEMNMSVDCVSGCRTGRPVPPVWKGIGSAVRLFYGVALGNPRQPLPGWLGFGEHYYNWWTSWIYGNPFHDVNCAFKLIRKSRIETVPIQCDDDGVHTELIAKLTFLTTLMAEVPLSPKPDPIPATTRSGMSAVLRKPLFRKPVTPAEPAQPAAVEPIPA